MTKAEELVTQNRQLVTDEEKSKQNLDDFIKDDKKSDQVDYSTHKRLLSQYKRSKEELDDLKKYKQDREDETALKKGQFEKILTAREERIKELEGELGGLRKTITDADKIDAVLRQIPGKVKKQEYLSFLDLEKITANPETGEIDKIAVETEVKKFVENYPDLIISRADKKLPEPPNTGDYNPGGPSDLRSMNADQLRAAYKAGKFKM